MSPQQGSPSPAGSVRQPRGMLRRIEQCRAWQGTRSILVAASSMVQRAHSHGSGRAGRRDCSSSPPSRITRAGLARRYRPTAPPHDTAHAGSTRRPEPTQRPPARRQRPPAPSRSPSRLAPAYRADGEMSGRRVLQPPRLAMPSTTANLSPHRQQQSVKPCPEPREAVAIWTFLR